MSQQETAGVATLARILVQLAEGEPLSVNALVAQEGLARSTTFAVVKRMEAANLARRHNGRLVPGSAAGEFAYAGFGLAPLFGRAETLLAWLRDETNAQVELQACDSASHASLLTLSAPHGKADSAVEMLVFPVHRQGDVVARLRLSRSETSMDAAVCTRLAGAVAGQMETWLA